MRAQAGVAGPISAQGLSVAPRPDGGRRLDRQRQGQNRHLPSKYRTRWVLDLNGNRTANKCSQDRCISSFGLPGDLPVVGDWNGNGNDKVGVFRPSTGEWLLDFNGNGTWDGCDVDACLSFGQDGDLPVVGKW